MVWVAQAHLDETAFGNLTDGKNENFRYVYWEKILLLMEIISTTKSDAFLQSPSDERQLAYTVSTNLSPSPLSGLILVVLTGMARLVACS